MNWQLTTPIKGWEKFSSFLEAKLKIEALRRSLGSNLEGALAKFQCSNARKYGDWCNRHQKCCRLGFVIVSSHGAFCLINLLIYLFRVVRTRVKPRKRIRNTCSILVVLCCWSLTSEPATRIPLRWPGPTARNSRCHILRSCDDASLCWRVSA